MKDIETFLKENISFDLFPIQRQIILDIVNGEQSRYNIMLGSRSGKTIIEQIIAEYYYQFTNVTWIQSSKYNSEQMINILKNNLNNSECNSECNNEYKAFKTILSDKIISEHNTHINLTNSNISILPKDADIIMFEDYDTLRKSNSRLGVRSLFDQATLQTFTSNKKLIAFGTPSPKDSDQLYIHYQWKDDPKYYSAIYNTWEITPLIKEEQIKEECKFNPDMIYYFDVKRNLKEYEENMELISWKEEELI